MKAIAAMCGDRVIGYKGKIPWKNSLDMRFFKAMTSNHPLIMGRTTFESVGILPQRYTYVISSQFDKLEPKKGDLMEYISPNLDFSKGPWQDCWVCGGAKVYQQFLPKCTDLYMTFITDKYQGDTYMPEFESLFEEQRLIYEGKDLHIVHLWKEDWGGYGDAYRAGFDAKLMGLSEDENPHELSGHPRDTTYQDECNYQWSSGWDDAPIVKGLNG